MSTYQDNLYRFPLALSVQLIHRKEQIDILLELEKKSFPSQMQAQRHAFKDLLEDEYATGLILYHEAHPIGYISGSHISDANSEDLLKANPFIQKEQANIFYIDSVAILDEERSVVAFDFIAHEMFALLKSIGYRYMTAHFRKSNGLSRLMQRRFGGKILKSYKNWNECEEPFDYQLVDLSKNPTLPTSMDYLFQALRFVRRKAKGIVIP